MVMVVLSPPSDLEVTKVEIYDWDYIDSWTVD